jgi:hypothetical protein
MRLTPNSFYLDLGLVCLHNAALGLTYGSEQGVIQF